MGGRLTSRHPRRAAGGRASRWAERQVVVHRHGTPRARARGRANGRTGPRWCTITTSHISLRRSMSGRRQCDHNVTQRFNSSLILALLCASNQRSRARRAVGRSAGAVRRLPWLASGRARGPAGTCASDDIVAAATKASYGKKNFLA